MNSPAGVPVWFQAVGFDAEQWVYVDIIEEKPFKLSQAPTKTELQSSIDTQGKAILHVNLDFNRASLRPDAQPVIREVVGVMNAEPSLKLEVDGHTDAIGADSYNQALSEERAKAVVASLGASGVDLSRLASAGFGASKPIADNATEQGRADNRRVELIRQ